MLRRILVAIFLFAIVSYSAPKALCWSRTHFGEGHKELIAASKQMVQDKFPEWYQEDVEVGVDAVEDYLGYTHRNNQGDLAIKLTQRGLDLCSVEDVAAVLLHEYVHAKLWVQLGQDFPNPQCNNVRHELEANWVVIQAYDELKYSGRMLQNTLDLFDHYYLEGLLFCNAKVRKGLPRPPTMPQVD